VDFPAFILVDDKGNDFFQQIASQDAGPRPLLPVAPS
jgi:tartrate dehydratase beta subunit/fumarate hydratase class I family protein